MKSSNHIKEIFSVFFKLGCVAFGGPAAHIALMEEEIISKRKWMSMDDFTDLIGATQLIPGPNSTEMTMHCGYARGGRLGLIVAGLSFIFPATIITGILAYLYVTYGELPEVKPFVYGIQPAVLAIIAAVILKLGKKTLKNIEQWILGAITIGLCFLGWHEVLALLFVGVIGTIYYHFKAKRENQLLSFSGVLLVSKISVPSVFLSFLKVGAILYGSGYVLFAYLNTELVETGILTRLQLADAIAMGQLTPGPVLSTATFIGYQVQGIGGAIAATAGVFLPSFFFILIFHPLINRLKKWSFTRFFLNSINVAALALICFVLYQMGLDSLHNWRNIIIAILGLLAVFVFKLNSMWVIVGGSLVGYLLTFIL